MEVLESIKRRRTTRIPFTNKNIPENDLQVLMEISRLSPSGDAPAWTLATIENAAIKKKLTDIVKKDFGSVFQKDSQKFRDVFSQYPKWLRFESAQDGIRMKNVPRFGRRLFAFAFGKTLGPLLGKLGIMNFELGTYCKNILSAPFVAGVFVDMRVSSGPSGLPAIWNAGSMLQNLRLAATSLGLSYQDLGWITAAKKGAENARKLLEVPEHFTAVNFFRVGYAGNPGKEQKKSDFRRDLSTIVHFEKFGKKTFSNPATIHSSLDILGAIRGKKVEPIERLPLRDKLGYILDAARWAPTGFNVQPFEFIVTESSTRPSIIIVEDSGRKDPDPGPCEELARGGVLQNIRLAANAMGMNHTIVIPAGPEQKRLAESLSLPPNFTCMAMVLLQG